MLRKILENKIQYKGGGGGGGYYHTYYYHPKEVLTEEAHKMFNTEIKKVFDDYDKEIGELLVNFSKKMQEVDFKLTKETNRLIMKMKKDLLNLEDKKEYTQKEKEKKIWLESILNELEEIMEI